MFIIGLGTALPTGFYTQSQCWQALEASTQFMGLTERSRTLVQKVLLADNGIESRYLALEPLSQAFDHSRRSE